MATFDSPTDLAAALYCEGRRPIDLERIRKFVRHVSDRSQFDAVMAVLPVEAQAQTDACLSELCQIDPKARASVAGWWL